jgi:hypothetical protein
MLFDEFVKVTADYWKQYLGFVSRAVSKGQTNSNNNKVLYPTILLCTKTDKYFIAELLGANPSYKNLIVKRHVEPFINRYINQFDTDTTERPLFNLDESENVRFINLILANQSDLKQVEKRFPFVKFEDSSTLMMKGSEGPTIKFSQKNYSATFLNCTLINTYLNAVRVKRVLYLTVINKSFTKQRYLKELPQGLQKGNELMGVISCSNEQAESFIVAGQFTNMFLMNKLRETTIGDFLKTHPEILKRALGTRRFVTEAYLPWIEKLPPNTDEAINPDLLIEREDGYYNYI